MYLSEESDCSVTCFTYILQMQDLYGAAGYFSELKGGSLKRKRSCVLSLFLSLLYCDLSLNSEEKNLNCQALFGAQASSLTS